MCLFIDPFLEKCHVESVRICILLLCQPIHEGREVIFDLFSIENSVYHMTTKQSHFYFVSCMCIYLLIFMNYFENIRSRRSVRKFKFIKRFLINSKFKSFVKILYWNLIDNRCSLIICVFKKYLCLHNLFIQFIYFLFVFNCFCTLKPFSRWHTGFTQTLWHLITHETLKKRLAIE